MLHLAHARIAATAAVNVLRLLILAFRGAVFACALCIHSIRPNAIPPRQVEEKCESAHTVDRENNSMEMKITQIHWFVRSSVYI